MPASQGVEGPPAPCRSLSEGGLCCGPILSQAVQATSGSWNRWRSYPTRAGLGPASGGQAQLHLDVTSPLPPTHTEGCYSLSTRL